MDIFKASIVGYKNKIKGCKSQDYVDYKYIDRGVICAVADGHSTNFFKYSDVGARLACKVCIEVLEEYSNNLEGLSIKLDEGILQKQIQDKWMMYVEQHYKKSNPIVRKTEELKYSTTLIGALITDRFTLYLKIGDGCIVEKSNNEYRSIINTEQKTIVDSLGRENSYTNIMYSLNKNIEANKDNDWIILFTDGYENSFASSEDLYKSLDTTISKYSKNIFSKARLNGTYKNYLNKLSKERSHDDISIIFIGLK